VTVGRGRAGSGREVARVRLGAGASITEDTTVRVASITKPIVATLVLDGRTVNTC